MDPSLWSQLHYLRGIGEYSRTCGRWTVTTPRLRSLLTLWREQGLHFDGALIASEDEEVVRESQAVADHVVGLDAGDSDLFEAGVHVDDEAIGRMAAEYFLKIGFPRIATAPNPHGHPYGARRLAAFRSALAAHGVSIRPDFDPPKDKLRLTEEYIEWLVAEGLPVAVFASEDALANQILRLLEPTGLRIPEDIAILGAENTEEVSMFARVPLSTVDVSHAHIGFRGAELLDRLMLGEPVPEKRVLVPPISVVTRASTDALAVADPLLSDAYRYIRQHLSEGVTVAHLERALHVSRRKLQRRTLEGWGCSPLQMILRLRIDEAKQLLAHSDRKVDDIAAASGFESTRALLRQFKQMTGQTPSEFRQQQRGRERLTS
ncbi:MAG: substrate-binding domain-containing protein [Verrucomicrobia bacterium]|nr:substrate-binding domain-containing protein [Verrucomicrobiota bacterium]